MRKDRSLVRASDVGTWVFCRRAWWLKNVAAADHERPDLLQRGEQAHEAHGRRFVAAHWGRLAGLALVALGLLLILAALLW
jgi:hypothetical protein